MNKRKRLNEDVVGSREMKEKISCKIFLYVMEGKDVRCSNWSSNTMKIECGI